MSELEREQAVKAAFIKYSMIRNADREQDAAPLLYDRLPAGEGNAVHVSDLIPLTGGDKRKLRAMHEQDLKNGFLTLSSGRGYFRPRGDPAHREEDLSSITHGRNTSLSRIKAEWKKIAVYDAAIRFMIENPDLPLPDRIPVSTALPEQLSLIPPTGGGANE